MCDRHNTTGLKSLNVIKADDLTDADKAILDALHSGPLTKGALVDKTGLHRNTVGNRLDALKFGGAISPIHEPTALYKLENDPREDIEPVSDVDTLQERIDEIRSELENTETVFERGDQETAREALVRAQEALSADKLDE